MGKRKSYKIFELDYLANAELTEDDLYYLYETPSLNYSLLVNMFIFSNQKLTDEKKIIKLAKTDPEWMYKYFWSDEQRKEYEEIVTKIYKNIDWITVDEAEQKMQWWILMYGLTNDKLKNNKEVQKLCEKNI